MESSSEGESDDDGLPTDELKPAELGKTAGGDTDTADEAPAFPVPLVEEPYGVPPTGAATTPTAAPRSFSRADSGVTPAMAFSLSARYTGGGGS